MYRVNYNTRANSDLMEIASYIADESDSIEIALSVVERMKKRIDRRLEIFPFSGIVDSIVDGIEYRKMVVEKYSFIYEIIEENDDIVIVTNVIHEKKDRK